MENNKWLWLQLFAGEGSGEGGGEAATGDDGAAAGHERLRALGVPEEKIRKTVKYNIQTPATAPAGSAPEETPADEGDATQVTPVADAETTTQEPAKRMSWDEIMADPEYNKQMQTIVQGRLREAKGAEDALAKMTPALEVLARKYGMDTEKIDYETLSQNISAEDEFYEDKALEMGVSVETAKRIDQEERGRMRSVRKEEATREEARIQEHIRGLEQQAEAMKTKFPGFDLRAELQNPIFARMTAPNGGVPVEAAYFALHHQELQAQAMSVAAQKTKENISKSIQAGSRRPDEAGTSAQAPSVTSFNIQNASKAQRDELRRRIMAGEKIYPGHEF